jgi:hypothetical protein
MPMNWDMDQVRQHTRKAELRLVSVETVKVGGWLAHGDSRPLCAPDPSQPELSAPRCNVWMNPCPSASWASFG